MAKKRRDFPVRPRGTPAGTAGELAEPPKADPRPGAKFYRAEALRAERILHERGGLTVDGVLEVGKRAQGWLTGEVAAVWERTSAPRVACEAGCAWCCHLAVSAWPMELLVLAAWLEKHRTAEELTALRGALRAAVAEGDEQNEAAPGRPRRQRCPLLVADRCSVYEVRPAACAGWNSASAEPCRAHAEGDDSVDFTVEPLRFFSARAVSEAAAAAVTRRGGPTFDANGGGPGAPVDLVAGLLAVLELGVHEAAEEWLAGRPLFAEARRRMERPPSYPWVTRM